MSNHDLALLIARAHYDFAKMFVNTYYFLNSIVETTTNKSCLWEKLP